MKRFFTAIVILFTSNTITLAQAPQGINYQAVLRDANGDILANANVTMKFTIQISAGLFTSIKYQETQALVTNEFGLINCVIGNGTVLQGNMTTVDWDAGSRFLKVEVDNGAGFVEMGIQQLVSVPYALSALNTVNAWGTSGNEETDATTHFIGTIDNQPLQFKINNEPAGLLAPDGSTFFGYLSGQEDTIGNNTAYGYRSLSSNIDGYFNTAIGYNALKDNNGYSNTATGFVSLSYNETGHGNTAHGSYTLWENHFGDENTAIGNHTLIRNEADANTACGSHVLYFNEDGEKNTALGYHAMEFNVSGSRGTALGYASQNKTNDSDVAWTNTNVSVGYYSLFGSDTPANNTGLNNSAIGYRTMVDNSTGNNNTCTGTIALTNNTTGSDNTANGYQSLELNTAGLENTAIGSGALDNTVSADHNTALGFDAGGSQTTGSDCTFLGYSAESAAGTYSNATAIGYQASVTASDRVRIGNSSVTQIGGQVGWSTLSDARLKQNIQPSNLGLSFINQLQPVTYNYIEGNTETRYTGFLAQDVEKTLVEMGEEFSGITAPENETDFYSIRYAEFVVPLVNAVQELTLQNEEMRAALKDVQATTEELKQIIADQKKLIDACLTSTVNPSNQDR